MSAFPGSLLWGVAAALLLAGGCQGGKRSPNQKAATAVKMPEDSEDNADSQMRDKARRPVATPFPGKPGARQQLPPGTCRMAGQVMAILPDRDPDRQSPCGQVPCRALVRVQQVLGYGAAFQPPLVPGQEIKVYFTFTLSPTGKFFPELTAPLPGLQTGSIFEADLSALPRPDGGQPGWFQVKAYQVP
jgi:hypothetical protein